jgi:dolichyl-phosphate beta-glucosyltransferase
MDLSVVIPVYNAAPFIEDRLIGLSRYLENSGIDYEIIPVDDGSLDGTGNILAGLGLPSLRPVLLKSNRGKYGALAEGVRQTLGNCVVLTDADIPYELSAIPYMVSLVNGRGIHIVIGDRNLPGSHYIEDMTPLRRVASRAFTLAIRLLVTSGLFDTQCGLKAVRGDVARAIFPVMKEQGFAGDVEMLYVALKYNLEIKRIPARLQFQGDSSVRAFRHGASMLWSLVQIRERHRRGAYNSDCLTRISLQEYWNLPQGRTTASPPYPEDTSAVRSAGRTPR